MHDHINRIPPVPREPHLLSFSVRPPIYSLEWKYDSDMVEHWIQSTLCDRVRNHERARIFVWYWSRCSSSKKKLICNGKRCISNVLPKGHINITSCLIKSVLNPSRNNTRFAIHVLVYLSLRHARCQKFPLEIWQEDLILFIEILIKYRSIYLPTRREWLKLLINTLWKIIIYQISSL